jgi:hypothetical protein
VDTGVPVLVFIATVVIAMELTLDDFDPHGESGDWGGLRID